MILTSYTTTVLLHNKNVSKISKVSMDQIVSSHACELKVYCNVCTGQYGNTTTKKYAITRAVYAFSLHSHSIIAGVNGRVNRLA
jgi:hypothetical protein